MLESLKKKMYNRHRSKHEKQVIDHSTSIVILCIYITLLIVTFSVIIVSNYQIVILTDIEPFTF